MIFYIYNDFFIYSKYGSKEYLFFVLVLDSRTIEGSEEFSSSLSFSFSILLLDFLKKPLEFFEY